MRGSGQGGFHLQGAADASVGNREELWEVLRRGEARKHYAATAMNERSSRAHTLLVVHLTHICPVRSTWRDLRVALRGFLWVLLVSEKRWAWHVSRFFSF